MGQKGGSCIVEKFDSTHINELLARELICSFNYDDQYV
jgi:hypothetical protein